MGKAHPISKAPDFTTDAPGKDLANVAERIAMRVIDLECADHIVGP